MAKNNLAFFLRCCCGAWSLFQQVFIGPSEGSAPFQSVIRFFVDGWNVFFLVVWSYLEVTEPISRQVLSLYGQWEGGGSQMWGKSRGKKPISESTSCFYFWLWSVNSRKERWGILKDCHSEPNVLCDLGEAHVTKERGLKQNTQPAWGTEQLSREGPLFGCSIGIFPFCLLVSAESAEFLVRDYWGLQSSCCQRGVTILVTWT